MEYPVIIIGTHLIRIKAAHLSFLRSNIPFYQQWSISPNRHCWGYYPGTCRAHSNLIQIHLKTGHPNMKSIDFHSSNELLWLKNLSTEHQSDSPNWNDTWKHWCTHFHIITVTDRGKYTQTGNSKVADSNFWEIKLELVNCQSVCLSIWLPLCLSYQSVYFYL